MKKLIYLLPVLLAGIASCSKTPSNVNAVTYPSGTYSGQFRLLYKKPGGTKIDTLRKANIQLVLQTGVGFKVLGDTATAHAGSKGHYAVNSLSISFQDDTYPLKGTPAKTHLNGVYDYSYDGSSVLKFVASSVDTLSLQYELKKVN